MPAVPPNSSAARRRPSRSVFGSIALAVIIVLAAWFLAGQQGLGELGKGGVNRQLLPRAGDEAPDITVTDILGNSVTLSSLRGQTVWLNFWGSWCPPCRAEMPDIQAAYEKLKPTGIVLIAISLDESPLDAALFAARNKVTFPIFTDPDRSATGDAYPIYNFPTHLFIDKNGIVRHVVLSEMTVEKAVFYVEDTMKSA